MKALLARAACGVAALMLAACGGPHGDGQPLKSSAEQIARGKYLAVAADCAACHTAPGGAPMAGGAPLESPFGVLYGSNITPHPEQGIGRWSGDDFYQAMHDGRSPGGRQLYPAMPYTSYRAMPRDDVDAVFAYLMQLAPVATPSRAAELKFPYNMRFAVFFWKLLFLENEQPAASAGQSADWQRGRYVSDVLGHCGECHTPRGWMGQMRGDEQWRGARIGRWLAPDITPQGLAARGWTEGDLAAFMKAGIAPQGSAYGEMHTVVSLSTQHLSEVDTRAMLRFIAGDAGLPPAAAVAVDAATVERLGLGRQTYLDVCAGCHGRDGEGKPHVAVAMAGNSTLRLADPRNLVVSVLDGLPAQEFPGLERMQDMTGFAGTLGDAEIADLGNYLRARFGGQSADLQAATIARLRHD
jgi:mono/diheme cytochrome c family protein